MVNCSPYEGENKVTKEQLFKELEKIRDAMAEAIIKLKKDEITIEEADAFTKGCAKRMANIEKELKELKKT
jgi:hypothetical protein